jgi:superfamily I DNA and RNA helicase
MANYLRDLINRLARYYDPHCHRMIQISHFHRLFPRIDETIDMETEIIKDPIDVLLIDEGQDFERSWILVVQKTQLSLKMRQW